MGDVTYYRNDGTFNTPIWISADSMYTGVEVDQSAHPGFADLDGDGRKDMIIGEYTGNFTYYKNLFSPITEVEDKYNFNVPDDLVLNQNYPNPFNPVTVIGYNLKENSKVTLKIFDVLGKEVAVLVNEEKPSGNYEVAFNASNLSSGIYIYTLKVNGISYSKSMMLVK